MEINLTPNTIVCIFGRPDTGKSYLASKYEAQLRANGIKTVIMTPLKSQKDKWNPANTLYLDKIDLQPREQGAQYIEKIMELGNYAIFIDEAHYIFHPYIDSSNNPTDLKLSAFIRHHAHRNCGAWFITQRAVKFYSSAIALSDYVICFRQKFPNDIARIAAICGEEYAKATTQLNFEKHEYAIYDMKKDTFEIITPES